METNSSDHRRCARTSAGLAWMAAKPVRLAASVWLKDLLGRERAMSDARRMSGASS